MAICGVGRNVRNCKALFSQSEKSCDEIFIKWEAISYIGFCRSLLSKNVIKFCRKIVSKRKTFYLLFCNISYYGLSH